ncbi:MAG: PEP-CTERM sorting domain-containing protein [Verrucomicrobia bacterium]|nr:PEP-CTERM sorting domain-containing protein [Verrucomicrobiota bacterium]
MNATKITKYSKSVWCISALLFAASSAFATGFTLPATTTGPGKIDLGFFSGGTVLSVTASGQISLLDGSGFNTFADGSLVNPINPVGDLANYGYVNAGASGYPTTFGGDGINHYTGGGLNYDVNLGAFGLAGAQSTDTTNPNTIRLGAVVGTFSASPLFTDWFYIGTGATIVVPGGGANLYVAVNDTTYPNNSGSYDCNINIVPEPTTASFLLIAAGGMLFRRALKASK